jgi:antitoxin PrlF
MSEITITKLSSKGQIVIPKTLRDVLGLKTGEVFALFGEKDTIILKKLTLPSNKEFDELLKWGKTYAKKNKISKKDVLTAIKETRKQG